MFDYPPKEDCSNEPTIVLTSNSEKIEKAPQRTTSRSTKPNVENELINPRQVRTFTKAKRIMAYVLRFLARITSKNNALWTGKTSSMTFLKDFQFSEVTSTTLTCKELSFAKWCIGSTGAQINNISTRLSTQKRLLATFANKLELLIAGLKEEKLEETPLEEQTSPKNIRENITRIEKGISAITSTSLKVEKTLHDFASLIDNLINKTDRDVEEFESYAFKAEALIANAFDFSVSLQARLQSLINSMASLQSPKAISSSSAAINQPQAKPIELPPLPIPTFAGNLWEWDNFWELFDTNINSRDLPEMIKYNYLLNALKGEARESVRKFQVTKGNYSKAITFLLNKYNNKEMLVNLLVEKLENCKLRTQSIKDQRCLLEQIQVIIAQLQEKGEEINSSWLVKKVLAKFPDSVKRKVIAKKQCMSKDMSLGMDTLFQYLDEILTTEEMFLLYTDTGETFSVRTKSSDSFTSRQQWRNPQSYAKNCMYCGGEHPSNDCTKLITPQERYSYLRRNRLCLICASSTHSTFSCRGKTCFKCKGNHHTSCCFRGGNNRPNSKSSSTSLTHYIRKSPEKEANKTFKASQSKVQTNTINRHFNNSEEEAISDTQEVLNIEHEKRAHLPTGEVTVLDPETSTLLKIDVLLDTGSEGSFIDSAIAEKLRLPVLEERQITIRTFGDNNTKNTECKRVQINVWDNEGSRHTLELFTHKDLTSSFQSPKLTSTDLEFITSMISPPILQSSKKLIKPRILLGCDQLWTFISHDKTPITLPSGLHLLPTKLGYLISGKLKLKDQSNEEKLRSAEEQWEQYWTLNEYQTNVIKITDPEVAEEEKEQWEKFWTLDSEGTEEFMGPEKEIRATTDEKVWHYFKETIQRRKDGYYVRLPWIEQHPPLPDNKAIAYKRLVSVWTSLNKNEELMKQYNNVFEEQLEKNIIEQVDERSQKGQNLIHYIPHQPVLTPQKTTTKLRIVFDASAHYKDCPSLNDVLYRGPVILPSLYGILLRFRFGHIAIISDIEKAFLQIRLQEQDRDATRFLWLQNYRQPPGSINNIRTFRFTRVTFGIKSSPFLLAGTTRYHLEQHESEAFIEEIKQNLYVDNLLQTTDELDEAKNLYKKTKQVFQDINMNLREFASNNRSLTEAINEKDRNKEEEPKVLGLKWKKRKDTVKVCCQFPEINTTTKRTITSAIASIYDPLGWFVPLLHDAKIFLQRIWKDKFDWDTELPRYMKEEWNGVVECVQGYNVEVSRYLSPKGGEAILLTFTDASNNAIAACTYLYHRGKCSILMAKSKLTPLLGKYTIPKLELNAVTLGARLSRAIFLQLRHVVKIQESYILSDSEIVLSWLKNKPENNIGQFLRNRLKEIKFITINMSEQGCQTRLGYVPR